MTLHAVAEAGSEPTAVYRAYDAHGVLLYVGLSLNALSRLYSHSLEKAWWTEVVRVQMEHFDSRPEAAAAEMRAIQSEGPRHNVAPGTPQSNRRRRITRQEIDDLRETHWMSMGHIECLNCGARPDLMPKGMLVPEVACERCDCETLERRGNTA